MGAPLVWCKHKEHDSMTRKPVARDHREDPISEMARQPVDNSGKKDMRLSQRCTETGVSVNKQ